MATVVEHNIGEGSLQLVRLDQEMESWVASELGCTIFCDPATGEDYIFTPGRADAERLVRTIRRRARVSMRGGADPWPR